MGQLRVDERGRAFAGSQLQVQLYSARRHGELEAAITATLNRRGEGLVWHAPIETARFEDGLATLRPSGTALLIEGKSYPAEMRGSGCQAKSARSRRMIIRAIDETKRWLGVAPQMDWLVNLCFVADSTTTPTSSAEWRDALTAAKVELGLGATDHVAVDVLLPGLSRESWDSGELRAGLV